MNTNRFTPHTARRTVIGLCIAAVTTFGAPGAAVAQTAAPQHEDTMQLVQLERTFWVCDYVATVNGVSATPVATCSAATDALKEMKFGGDFLQLLEWWRENKQIEHERLAAASAAEAHTAKALLRL